jgi:ABC-type transport system substrate-binding protein
VAGTALLLAAALVAGQPAGPDHAPPLWPADLARSAAKAPPAVADLYKALAAPYDEVKLPDGGTRRVPLPGGKEPGRGAVTRYEEFALNKVAALLADKEVPDLERARTAEEVLTVVLRFHLAVRDRGPGGDPRWKGLEDRLRRELLGVRLGQLRALADEARQKGEWARALALADRLTGLYPTSKRVRAGTAEVWGRYAEERLKANDYPAARAYQRRLERLFPNLPRAAALGRDLRGRAEALVKEARGLPDKAAAADKLKEALRTWPRLPGLRDELLKLRGAYPVLYVGVRSLPERLSPATAWTDPEKQAVELLFERLVREVYDGRYGERYRPGLADGLPAVVPGGRRCRLARDAYWSDGTRVTSTDVRNTAAGTTEYADLVEAPIIEEPFRIDFRFRRGFLDPLLPLSFHVLPQTVVRADDPAFAAAPVGSGPFRYAGRKRQDGREYAVFTANPCYRAETGKPSVREVRFFAWKDPVKDWQDPAHPAHLLLDVPTDQLTPLRRLGTADVRTLPGRRVYILAVNHNVAALKSQALRRALAHGIDREAVLTACFRGGDPSDRARAVLGAAAAVAAGPLRPVHAQLHRPANGPYPPHSWACAPAERVPADLYDPERARELLAKARDEDRLARVEVTLKYPDDDPHVGQACREIARQLAALGDGAKCPIRLKLVGLPPHALARALRQRDYELAYHHIDYASEAYWLWPLFDTRMAALAPGGANYLGYSNDGVLEGLFRAAMSHRDFARVREITHDIHAHLAEKMPLVPLWQLDTHIAVHPDLTPAELDPLLVFGGVAEWKLKTR